MKSGRSWKNRWFELHDNIFSYYKKSTGTRPRGVLTLTYDSTIKQVAADLSAAVPGLKTFVTLSPIPGLCRWIEAEGLGVPAEAAELRRLAARYLMSAKRADGQPLDRVARFHLGNGAIIHQLHARGDTSDKGLAQSAGAMVNYLYDLSNVAQNQERYAAHREIAASLDVRSLVAAADKVRA